MTQLVRKGNHSIGSIPSSDILAKRFSAGLRREMTEEQINTVIMANELNTDEPMACYSTYFCEPDKVMVEAMQALGLDPEAEKQVQGRLSSSTKRLWNEAWTKAKQSHFRDDEGSTH